MNIPPYDVQCLVINAKITINLELEWMNQRMIVQKQSFIVRYLEILIKNIIFLHFFQLLNEKMIKSVSLIRKYFESNILNSNQ